MVGLLFLSSLVLPLCGGCRGLVGLLFEICIVDASIFTARLVVCDAPVFGGVSGMASGCVVSV